MTELARRRCAPCNAETPPIEGKELDGYRRHLHRRWSVVEEHHLAATFHLDDFAAALDLANRMGEIAEAEGHHPEICLTWGRLKVRLWTHVIDGLSENDFILAAKIDRLVEPPPEDGAAA